MKTSKESKQQLKAKSHKIQRKNSEEILQIREIATRWRMRESGLRVSVKNSTTNSKKEIERESRENDYLIYLLIIN